MDETGEMPDIRLVAGLGNPGREYAGTRHNVGFDALDRFAASQGADWEAKPAWRAMTARCPSGVLLLKPMTYMNLSGQAVAAAAGFFKIGPSSVLVVFDDAALPLGRLRLRLHGSHGGQNGMRSIIEHLGTREIPRLRIGIGDTGGGDLSSHVLGRFAAHEAGDAQAAIARAAEAIDCIFKKGIDQAMNIHNKDPKQL